MIQTLKSFFLVGIIAYSCTQNKEIMVFKEVISNGGQHHPFYYLYIPDAGCDGCISFGETLLIQNKNNENIQFIIDTPNSKKELKLKLGFDIFEYSNISIDSTSMFQSQLHTIYPIIFVLNTDLITIDHFYFKPDESRGYDLIHRLKNDGTLN